MITKLILRILSSSLRKEAEQIKNIVDGNKGKLNFLNQRKVCEQIVDNDTIDKLPGLYIFVINSSVTVNVCSFNSVNHAPKLNCNDSTFTFERKDILYLGKDETSIKSRVGEHLNNITPSTYSLRINDPARNMLNGKSDLYSFVIDERYKRYSRIILTEIEKNLHTLMCPKVGTSK